MDILVYNRLKLFVDVVLSEFPSDEGTKTDWLQLKQAYLKTLSLEESSYAKHDKTEVTITISDWNSVIFKLKSRTELVTECSAPNILIPKIDYSLVSSKYKEINNYFCEKFNTFDTAVLESDTEITDKVKIVFDTTKQEFVLFYEEI
jgi:hypothetical protein